MARRDKSGGWNGSRNNDMEGRGDGFVKLGANNSRARTSHLPDGTIAYEMSAMGEGLPQK